MQDYAKNYIEKIETFLKEKKEPLELILIGGLALSFYGETRYTVDIDGEVNCSEDLFFSLIEHLKKEGIEFNIGENISNWGVIPLPEGYRGRAILVHKGEYLVVKVLEPLDFIFSKLLRGTEEDFMDIVRVAKRYQISKEKIIEREKMIKYPKDPETLFFKRKLDHLLGLIN